MRAATYLLGIFLSLQAWCSDYSYTGYFSPQNPEYFFNSLLAENDHGFKRIMLKNSSLICYISDIRMGKIHKLECQLTVKVKDITSFENGIAFKGELPNMLWQVLAVDEFIFPNKKLKSLGPIACLEETIRGVNRLSCALRL